MSAAFTYFDSFIDGLAQGKINLATDALYVALFNTQPNESTVAYTTLTGEITGGGTTGYTVGGMQVPSTSVTNYTDTSWSTIWAASTAYSLGAIIKPKTGSTGFLYQAVGAGTSSATEPTWGTTVGSLNATPEDGTNGLYWLNIGVSVDVLIGNQVTWTAGASGMGPFQYVVLYDATATTKYNIGYWNYGSGVSLASGETFTWQPNGASTGGTILTLA